MTDKSHVTLEQKQCIVCGIMYDTGKLLLDTKLRNVFAQHTCTGYGLCHEHDMLYKRGYVALIECVNDTQPVSINDVVRSGRVLSIPKQVLLLVADIEVPDNAPIAFVAEGFIDEFIRVTSAQGANIIEIDHTLAPDTVQ